jgi:hypothetical protein
MSVDRGRAREDDVLAAGIAHRLEQRDRAADVVLVVLERLVHRLAHGLEPGKVDDAVDGRARKRACKGLPVADIPLDELRTRTRDLLDAVDDDGRRVAEVVEDHGLMPCLLQRNDRMASDETRATRDQNSHSPNPFVCIPGKRRIDSNTRP